MRPIRRRAQPFVPERIKRELAAGHGLAGFAGLLLCCARASAFGAAQHSFDALQQQAKEKVDGVLTAQVRKEREEVFSLRNEFGKKSTGEASTKVSCELNLEGSRVKRVGTPACSKASAIAACSWIGYRKSLSTPITSTCSTPSSDSQRASCARYPCVTQTRSAPELWVVLSKAGQSA